MNPPSILFVIGSLNIGGAERHLAQILPPLARHGWRPSVYCLTEPGDLARDLQAQGIPVHCAPTGGLSEPVWRLGIAARMVRNVFALARFMRKLDPAVAHFFLPLPYIIGAPAAVLAGVPVRIMSRRSLNEYQKGHRYSAWLEKLLHKTTTAVLGNSRRVTTQLMTEEGVPARRLALIYNGIDIAAFDVGQGRSEARSALGLEPSALTFVIVANLIQYKGHADLLEALARANPLLPAGWRLLVVGRDDGIGAELRALAEARGLGDNVLFLGPRRDIAGLLRSADIGLLTSHQEGFSNALLEYMASQLAIVATDVGGNSEAVVDGDSGVIVPPHDPARLADAIVRLATDDDLRRRLGLKARRRVADEFSLDACVARYDALYRGLTTGKRVIEIDGVEGRGPVG